MSHTKIRSGKRSGSLALLKFTPIMAALITGSPAAQSAAPVPPVKATVKYDKKLDRVIVNGVSSKAFKANSKVSVYDTANQVLLYSVNTNNTGKFSIKLPITGKGYVPCSVRLETVNALDNTQSKIVIPVAGATGCATALACTITSPGKYTEITVGSVQNFAATPIKTKKGKTPPSLTWKLGDGSVDQTTTSATHTYDQVGRYRVTLSAADATTGSKLCSDDVIVSVIPTAGTNPNGKVSELTPPTIASGMPKADGSNDKDAYVVLPFEDMGMQGGSQINLPYNPMINYNTLNAQVIQKKEHKPPLVTNTNVDVTYSAASNDMDPIAKNSINSTSQNMFDANAVGANWDLATTVFSAAQVPTDVKFLSGQDFNKATIRKTEQWDRMHQPYSALKGIKETGATFAEKQNTYSPAKPVEKPDEGVKSFADNAAASRKMPGAANPYVANEPQKFDFYSNQDAFVAQLIPASDIDDQGRTNPYPLMRVQAKDKDNVVVATTDAVYTTASETRCRECHSPGGIAANEDVWRTPVTETELTDLTDPTKPGPATGAGRNGIDEPNKGQVSGFDPGIDPTKPWAPAIHNRFNDKLADNPNYSNLNPGVTKDPNLPTSVTNIQVDQNGLRKDRVKASRWAKFDPTTDKPMGNVATGTPAEFFSDVKPAAADTDPSWRIQVQLNFADASKYGVDAGKSDSWVNQEKAALFNTLIMHDYMVFYGPTPSTATTSWPASFSTQVADNYGGDDVGKSPASPMYFCSGHHQSALKADVGVNGRTYPTNRSDYSRAFHAFHGKMQVYKKNVPASESVDGLAHIKGDLIRDVRGHPLEYGGRGWDSQLDDDNGIPFKVQTDGTFPTTSPKGTPVSTWDKLKYTIPTYSDPSKNNWRPDLYPKNSNGESMLPFGKDVPVEQNCAKCHTGSTEKGFRDIHHTAGLKCDSCHADMLAVGNVFGNEKYDANLSGGGAYGPKSASLDPTDFRRPWLDEPNCGSCHIGDANMSKTDKHLFSAGALNQAWKDGDITGYSMDPMNARFAVMPTISSLGNVEVRPEKVSAATVDDVTAGYKGLDGTVVKVGESFYRPTKLSGVLYRKSGDVHGTGPNGTLTCSTCHGGSHAIWPNQDPNANDNQTAKQLQGYDGNIAECSVCHIKDDFKTGLVATDGGTKNLGVGQGVRDGVVVTPTGKDVAGTKGNGNAYLAGPHGLHPVGDESWYKHADGAAGNTSPGKHNPLQNGGWHNDMAKMPGPDGEDQCAACHGDDHKGTRLSKTLTDRTLTKANGKPVKVVKGQIIGCDLCHTIAKSFTDSPVPYNAKKAPTGGWPPALMHMPPMPDSFTGAGGAGGHNM